MKIQYLVHQKKKQKRKGINKVEKEDEPTNRISIYNKSNDILFHNKRRQSKESTTPSLMISSTSDVVVVEEMNKKIPTTTSSSTKEKIDTTSSQMVVKMISSEKVRGIQICTSPICNFRHYYVEMRILVIS